MESWQCKLSSLVKSHIIDDHIIIRMSFYVSHITGIVNSSNPDQDQENISQINF